AAEQTAGAHASWTPSADARLWRSFEHSPLGVCLCDPEGRTLWVNRAFAAMLAIPPEDLLGARLLALIDGRDAPAVSEAVAQLASGRHERFDLRARLLASRGHAPDVKLFLSTVRSSGGEVEYIVAQALDVTSQQRTEGRLIRRLELEKIAASIGTELTNTSRERLDEAVAGALGHIAEFVGADAGFVVRVNSD